MKKRALGLSGKAAMEEGAEVLEGGTDERKSRVVRHKRNSFGDTGTSPARSPSRRRPASLLLLLLLFYSLVPPSRPFWPRDPVLFYWFMGFFSRGPPSRTSERADCESSLLLSSADALDSHTLWRERNGRGERGARERERERAKRKREEQ